MTRWSFVVAVIAMLVGVISMVTGVTSYLFPTNHGDTINSNNNEVSTSIDSAIANGNNNNITIYNAYNQKSASTPISIPTPEVTATQTSTLTATPTPIRTTPEWPTLDPVNVSIDYPEDGSIVDNLTDIYGSVKEIPEGYHLWILVYSCNNSLFYPLQEVRPTHSIYLWNVTQMQIGEPDTDNGNSFYIQARLVNDSGNIQFNNYTDEGYNVTQLPKNTECASITVVRKK